jgi:hypothetical protein
VKRLLFFLFTFISHSAQLWAGQSEFENLLERNDRYKQVINNYQNGAEDPELKKAMTHFGSAFDRFADEHKDPKVPSATELEAQAVMDMNGCSTCQNYLNLSGDVNKILSKIEINDKDKVADFNSSKLALNRLSFLYYTVKYEMTDGHTLCQKHGNFTRTNTNEFPGTFRLLAEEAFDLPNVNEVQYIPEGGKEVVYLYRGVGEEKNKVYEVHMLANGKAMIRFYRYSPSSAELNALEDQKNMERFLELTGKRKKEEKKEDNYISLGMDLKTRDKLVPTDIEVLKAGSKTEISENLVLDTKTKVSFNEQSTEISLAKGNGEQWLQVNAKNKTEGIKEFVTIIPVTVNLDKDSKLNVTGSVKAEVGLVQKTGEVSTAQTYNLGLTDHDHKYIEVELYQKPTEDFKKVSVSNNYKLGDVGSVGMNLSQDSNGLRTYSVANHTNMGDYGTLKTEFGSGSNGNRFVQVQHEVAIGKATTVSFGAKAEDGQQYSAMFQLKSRF